MNREKIVCWGLLALALLVSVQTVRDQWSRVGRPAPGFGVMDTKLVAVGGLDVAELQPFDLIRAVNGQLIRSGRELQAEIQRHPAGTQFQYLVSRRGQLLEARIPSVLHTRESFHQFLLEGFLPALLYLVLGALVLTVKPGAFETRLFLVFCLTWFTIPGLYLDAFTTYRFNALFLTAWAFLPAVQIHLAFTFPERRSILGCHPRAVWLVYAMSGLLAVALQVRVPRLPVAWTYVVPAIGAAVWGLSLILLILALWRTSAVGSTPLIRQRARVLAAGFAVGQLAPVLLTCAEAIFGVKVPYLNEVWRLNFVFPLAVAYAMVRYNLFDLRMVIRTGTVYAAVTGVGVLAYAGAIALVNVGFTSLELGRSDFVPGVIAALAVVLFLNPVYARIQAVVDRLFFRQRLDVQQSLERLSHAMATLLDLPRIGSLMANTLDELFRLSRRAVLVLDESGGVYRAVEEDPRLPPPIPRDAPLLVALAAGGTPISRERLLEDPGLARIRETALARMDAYGVELLVPIFFQDRMTAFLALGRRLSGLAYTTADLKVIRLLGSQSAVALEHAKAYSALEAAHRDLQSALRRVQILESIRASLSKFVPKTVQDLIEQAPDAPELAKREVDVSVLFVDIAGYSRLSEQFDLERVNDLVERYFAAFLDEIVRNGGDVNEAAGDGLMVIFQDGDPRRHGRAAVLTAAGIIRHAARINRDLAGAVEPIRLHVGVNSGVAAVGATKIEGRAGTRWTYTASGPVTNLAARLAALGEGEAVHIGPETARRLDGEFPLADLGERRLKNIDEPVHVWTLMVEPEPVGV